MFLIEKVREEVKQGLDANTIDLLKRTRVPMYPYIVCESRHVRWSSEGREHNKVVTGLAFLNLSGQVKQKYLLNDYIVNKGSKIITYGNFPTATIHPQQYNMHNEPNGSNAYDMMAHACESYLGNVVSQTESERKLKTELAEMQKKLSELENNTKETHNGSIKGLNKSDASGAGTSGQGSQGKGAGA